MDSNTIRSTILCLLEARSAESSICPSDAARAIYSDEHQWRELMPQIRDVARQMAIEGLIQITQKHRVIQPDREPRGPIRISKINSKGQTS